MTPDQTAAYIQQKAPEFGADPAIALSLAELTSYAPKWTGQGRSGILQVPNQYIKDLGAFQKNPEAQIDAGLMLLAKQRQASDNEFGALTSYTGSPKTALKAYLRTMKYRGESISPEQLNEAIQGLGLDLDPMAEARRAGLRVEQKPTAPPAQQSPKQATPQPQAPDMMPAELASEPETDPMDYVAVSSTKDRRKRVNAAFGDSSVDGDIPEDLIAYVKGLVK